MHDPRAGFGRAEEVDRMIRRIAEKQRDRVPLAVARTQERSGGNIDPRREIGERHLAVAEIDDRPVAELG